MKLKLMFILINKNYNFALPLRTNIFDCAMGKIDCHNSIVCLIVVWYLCFCQELHHDSLHRGFATQQSEPPTLPSCDIQPGSQWSYEDRSHSPQSAGESQFRTRHSMWLLQSRDVLCVRQHIFFTLTFHSFSHPTLCLFSLQCSILSADDLQTAVVVFSSCRPQTERMIPSDTTLWVGIPKRSLTSLKRKSRWTGAWFFSFM